MNRKVYYSKKLIDYTRSKNLDEKNLIFLIYDTLCIQMRSIPIHFSMWNLEKA